MNIPQQSAPPDCRIVDSLPTMQNMPMRTTAIEAAAARGWSHSEMVRRTGLSRSTIHNLVHGTYDTISGRTIDAIMRAFPDLPYERLFVPTADSRKKDDALTPVESAA